MGKAKKAAEPSTASFEVTRRQSRFALALILTIYLLFAVAYNIVVPAGSAVQHNDDENAHVLYIQRLVEGHLPVFTSGSDAYENHQPPFYYLLCVPVWFALHHVSPSLLIHGIRAVSTLIGILLILVFYRTARMLFPKDRTISLATAAFVALLPMNLNLDASVNNDTLANLVIAAGVGQCVQIIVTASEQASRKWIVRQSLCLGALLGIGILTKTSAFLLMPVILFTFIMMARRHLVEPRIAALGAGISAITGMIIGAPWMIRNQILYGDPLAQHVFQNAFGNTAQAPDMIRDLFGGDMGAYFEAVSKWTFASYWGVFDSMTLFWGQPPGQPRASVFDPLSPVYDIILGVILLSLGGLVRAIARKAPQISPRTGLVYSMLVTMILFTAVVFLRFILTFFQAQGRYLYPALLPFTILFSVGLYGLSSRPAAGRILACLIIISLIALNIYTLFFQLRPRFIS